MSHIRKWVLLTTISSTLLPIVGEVCTTSFIELQNTRWERKAGIVSDTRSTAHSHNVFHLSWLRMDENTVRTWKDAWCLGYLQLVKNCGLAGIVQAHNNDFVL